MLELGLHCDNGLDHNVFDFRPELFSRFLKGALFRVLRGESLVQALGQTQLMLDAIEILCVFLVQRVVCQMSKVILSCPPSLGKL